MRVDPKARRADQTESRNVIVRDGRHLGRDHAAHRMADQDRVLQAECLDHVPGVEREVEHVANLAALLAVAVAGQQRRIDMVLRGQLGEERIGRRRTACAMQEHERLSRTAFNVAHGHLVGFHGF